MIAMLWWAVIVGIAMLVVMWPEHGVLARVRLR